MTFLPSPVSNPSEPDLRAVLQQLRMEILFGFNCHQVGTIVSFDATKQTAQIQLNLLRLAPKLDADPAVFVPQAYPLLVDCPVHVLAQGGGRLTFPIIAGDICLVLFNDRDLDNWWATGNTAVPNSPRCHDLSDGLALVGFFSKAQALANYLTNKAEFAYGGSTIQLDDKLHVANAATDLKTLFDNFIATLKAWVDTRGDTPNAATLTALDAIKTQADSLFK